MKKSLNVLYSYFDNDQYKVSLFFLLIFLAIFSIYSIHPRIEADSVSYAESIEVLRSGASSVEFIPNRIITTIGGLRSIMLVQDFVGRLDISWLIVNSILYIIMGMFFYSLLSKIVDDHRTTFLGTLFLVTNYAAVIFSFHYLMDVGGWAFYIASIYYSYLYLETKDNKWLLIGTTCVGVGGLFKEYAFLAYVVVFGLIIYIYWKQWFEMSKKIILTGCIAFGPILILNIYSSLTYHYTYLDWFFNQPIYVYKSRIIEYIKSFGSLYNFGWFLFIGGFYIFIKQSKNILKDKNILFIWLVVLSSTLVFVWPIVTRVLFITMPGVVLISSLFIKKIEKWWGAVVLLLLVYIWSTYLMDVYILNIVNIQVVFNYFLH